MRLINHFVKKIVNKSTMKISAEIVPVKYNRRSIYTLISDDGEINTAIHLKSLAEKYKMCFTIACTANNWNENEDVYRNLIFDGCQNGGKLEIISHSWSHFKFQDAISVNREIYHQEITESIKFFENKLKNKQICYVCPNNYADEKIYKNLSENKIIALRRWVRGENSLSPRNGTEPGEWLNLKTQGIGDVETTFERNIWIDSVINNENWLIEMWHNIETPGYQSISLFDADAHLNYISNKQDELWVAGFEEATKYIMEKQNIEVQCKILLGKVFLWCELNSLFSKKIFNEEITIKLQLANAKHYKAKIDGKEISTRYTEESGIEYIYFEMKPNDLVILK